MRRGAPLALFWFLYFAGLGVFFPYYSLYLRENAGLTGTEVGLVTAMLPLVGIVAQPLWVTWPIGRGRASPSWRGCRSGPALGISC